MSTLDRKYISDSQVTLSQFMQPEHANALGNVHGGWIMKLSDEAGGLCATRHARRPAVTVAVDSLRFLSPVHVGDLVTFTAHLNWTGRTSMEVEVNVEAENLYTGQKTHTNSAYLVYVALDDAGILEQLHRPVDRGDRDAVVHRRATSIEFLDVRVVVSGRQHARDDPTLLGHAHALGRA